MKKSLNVQIVILVFIVLIILMYFVNIYYRERYEEMADVMPPVYEFSKEVWTIPSKNKYIQRYNNLGISQGRMTFSFWLDVRKIVPYWRNIFHVSTSDKIEYKPAGTTLENLPYDFSQDFTRLPAIFIHPNKVGIHVCHDTLLSKNNAFDVFFSNPSHITLVWNAEQTAPSCTVYVNGQGKSFYKYNSPLQIPDGESFLYICDRFYGNNDFAIKDFQVFNYALTPQQVNVLYQTTPFSKVTVPKSITTNIKVRHPDGRVWKVDGDKITLNKGIEMSLSIGNFPDVYLSSKRRIALLQDGQKTRSIRHSGYVMWTHNFEPNNLDFAWYLEKNEQGVKIFNDFAAGYYVGYDSSTDRVLIVPPSDKRVVTWSLEPLPSDLI